MQLYLFLSFLLLLALVQLINGVEEVTFQTLLKTLDNKLKKKDPPLSSRLSIIFEFFESDSPVKKVFQGKSDEFIKPIAVGNAFDNMSAVPFSKPELQESTPVKSLDELVRNALAPVELGRECIKKEFDEIVSRISFVPNQENNPMFISSYIVWDQLTFIEDIRLTQIKTGCISMYATYRTLYVEFSSKFGEIEGAMKERQKQVEGAENTLTTNREQTSQTYIQLIATANRLMDVDKKIMEFFDQLKEILDEYNNERSQWAEFIIGMRPTVDSDHFPLANYLMQPSMTSSITSSMISSMTSSMIKKVKSQLTKINCFGSSDSDDSHKEDQVTFLKLVENFANKAMVINGSVKWEDELEKLFTLPDALEQILNLGSSKFMIACPPPLKNEKIENAMNKLSCNTNDCKDLRQSISENLKFVKEKKKEQGKKDRLRPDSENPVTKIGEYCGRYSYQVERSTGKWNTKFHETFQAWSTSHPSLNKDHLGQVKVNLGRMQEKHDELVKNAASKFEIMNESGMAYAVQFEFVRTEFDGLQSFVSNNSQEKEKKLKMLDSVVAAMKEKRDQYLTKIQLAEKTLAKYSEECITWAAFLMEIGVDRFVGGCVVSQLINHINVDIKKPTIV